MPARPDWPPTRTLAWLYSPVTQRPLLAALCGIESELAVSLGAGLDHQVAHLRLGWWREECERCTQGRPAHPLTRALAANFAPAERAPLAALTGVVDTAIWDLAAAAFDSRLELTAYCERWSAALIEPLARFALPGIAAGSCRALGRGLREIEMLSALAGDARAGRLRLPLDELARAHVPPESLAQPPWAAGLAGLVRERHRQLRAELAASVDALARHEQAALRGLMVWAALAWSYSLRAERALPGAITSGDHHRPLDGWRAWRAARRADAGRFALRAKEV
ncbi:MAG TPA: squalene/phytoene synthase family protein [Steroidobacteraceae bacterium]